MARTACMRLTFLAAAHMIGLPSDVDQDNLALPQLLETVSPNSWEPSTPLHLDCPHIKPVLLLNHSHQPRASSSFNFLAACPSCEAVSRK